MSTRKYRLATRLTQPWPVRTQLAIVDISCNGPLLSAHYQNMAVQCGKMQAVGVVRLVRSLAAILLVVSLGANGQDVRSWGNLNSIAAGQALEVHKVAGGSVRGNYAAHSEQSIDLTVNQQLVSIARAQVSEVQRSPRTRKAMWIGLAVGAGAGAAVGAGIGSRFEQSGDFGNATSVGAAIFAGVGALAGLGIGSAFAHRHTTVYRAK